LKEGSAVGEEVGVARAPNKMAGTTVGTGWRMITNVSRHTAGALSRLPTKGSPSSFRSGGKAILIRGQLGVSWRYKLRRIYLPRTQVNKGKEKSRACRSSGPSTLAPVAYLAPTFQLRLAGSDWYCPQHQSHSRRRCGYRWPACCMFCSSPGRWPPDRPRPTSSERWRLRARWKKR
jgi:hypothetical protein